MMDLTQEQKEFITSKQEEYHQFSTKINLLENEASELRVLRREKLDECETAKDEYNSANRTYWANQSILDDNKIKFVNRGEIKHIFSFLGKGFVCINLLSIIATLFGLIDVVDFKDGINYFLCMPLLGDSFLLVISNLFYNKVKSKLIVKFYELDESKRLLDTIDRNSKVVNEKRKLYEEKKNDLKKCDYRIEQVEYKINCNKYEMDKIKTAIFEMICSTDNNELDSGMSLSMKK